MQERFANRSRLEQLKTIARWLAFVLFARVLYLILAEYPSYFPANFNSAFLTGRQEFFHGLYRFAFYVHIVTGPISVVMGLALLVSGLRGHFPNAHRRAGRALIFMVGGLMAPSGLVMASRAYTGPIAGWGFAALSLATMYFAWMTMSTARARNFQQHKLWATRLFILLCSPFLLRLFSGTMIVTQLESPTTYRLSAWLSWIVPLLIFELTIPGQKRSGYRAGANVASAQMITTPETRQV